MATAVARNGRATRTPLKVHGPNGVSKPLVPPQPRKVAPQTVSANGSAKHPVIRRKPTYRLASDLKSKSVDWHWHLRIPLGELTGIDGDPGVHKSSFAIHLAACTSSGKPMPSGPKSSPAGVVLLTGEDSLEKTVIRRLDAAGAERSRIAVLDESMTIPDDLDVIEEAVCKVRAKLFIIDPLMAFLGRDANSDQKVRRALTPLKQLAERTNISVTVIRHLNKRGGRQALWMKRSGTTKTMQQFPARIADIRFMKTHSVARTAATTFRKRMPFLPVSLGGSSLAWCSFSTSFIGG